MLGKNNMIKWLFFGLGLSVCLPLHAYFETESKGVRVVHNISNMYKCDKKRYFNVVGGANASEYHSTISNQTLTKLLDTIIPVDWNYNYYTNGQKDKRISLTGNKNYSWISVLRQLTNKYNLCVTVNFNTKQVDVLYGKATANKVLKPKRNKSSSSIAKTKTVSTKNQEVKSKSARSKPKTQVTKNTASKSTKIVSTKLVHKKQLVKAVKVYKPSSKKWIIKKGDLLQDTIQRWCDNAKWDLVWDYKSEKPDEFESDAVLTGDFLVVIGQLFQLLQDNGSHLGADAYEFRTNKTLRVSRVR